MERQAAMIERQITEIEMAIEAVKAEKGERYTIKQMEKTKIIKRKAEPIERYFPQGQCSNL